MHYYVIGPDGTKYGPADINLIKQWIAEGRIVANTTIEDAATGQRSRAVDMPSIGGLVAGAPNPGQPTGPGQPPYGAPYSGYPRMNPTGYGQQPIQIETHLAKSIFAVLCCCMPLGIAALVFSVMAGNKAKAGDPAAIRDAQLASSFANWSIGIGLVFNTLYFLGALMSGFNY